MANKSFLTIKTNVGAEVKNTEASFATLIGRFINRRYFQILRAINWQNIQPDYSFTTVSGTQSYVLPDDFGKEISCEDRTNDTLFAKGNLNELNEDNALGSYAIYEDVVKAQPTSSSALAIVSSSASDTTQTILIRGISSGVETYESVTLTGATPANTTNSYTRIKGISKSGVTVGKVTITSNSGAVTQAVIPGETLVTRYKLLRFNCDPSAVYTINLPYIINPMPLSQDYDYPIMDCADLLELGALADAWRYMRQFGKAQALEVMFNQQVNEMIWDKENQPNQINQFIPTVYDKDGLY